MIAGEFEKTFIAFVIVFFSKWIICPFILS